MLNPSLKKSFVYMCVKITIVTFETFFKNNVMEMAIMKPLLLEKFLPYRLSYLSNIISRRLEKLYAEDFKIAPQEWKVIAILHHFPRSSAAQVGERTAMDKVAVSRAIKSLEGRNLISKDFCADDRRRSILTLTPQGQEIYRQVEPLATAYEKDMTDILNAQEQQQLDHLIRKLTDHALKSKD